MKKINLFASVVCLVLLASSLFSCTEKAEVGEFDDWQARNTAFIDSIANVCDKNVGGNWKKICAYNLNDSVEALAPNNAHYIYVQTLEKGTGEYSPLFNDSVRVHYLGRIAPSSNYPQGRIFDKSYSSYTFNEATDVPTKFGISTSVVTGFATALMHMVEGDSWRVYIPSYLGYGTTDKPSIPIYSTLIFDIKLARVYRLGIDKDTSWR